MFQRGLQENSAQQNQMGLTPASRSRILRANSRQRVSSKGVSTVTRNSANGLIFMIEYCKAATANNKTGSTIYVGAPAGTPAALAVQLNGSVPAPALNECKAQ
jgi:hypothetical protein